MMQWLTENDEERARTASEAGYICNGWKDGAETRYVLDDG